MVLLALLLLLSLSLVSEVRSSVSSLITIQYRLQEEQPAGTQVGRLLDDLRQRGADCSLGDFKLVEHSQALPFSVSTRDGVITTQGRLDREKLCRSLDLCELAFSILYRRGGAVSFLWVRVEVIDLNDNSPSFPSALQEVEISETASLRMRIPLDQAVDLDAGPNSLQTYSLSVNKHFDLEVITAPGGAKVAELVVIKELDREVQAFFNLTLLAWDKGNPQRSGSTLVHVTILDSNDNSPVFEDSSPTVYLPEDTTQGTTVINLKATDPDQGANGEVEYSLGKHTWPEVQRLFSVEPQTGSVLLTGPLDYEAQPFYEVVIQACDHGPNAIPSHCKLHIKLRDVNDNAPLIHTTWNPPTSPVATVLEGAAQDTFIALVMVSDADSGDNGRVSAHIQPHSGPFSLKHIHGDNYMIVTNGSLDRERVMQYNITLYAQDYGEPPLSCSQHLAVQVVDENDNPPVFSTSLYEASLMENNVAGYQAIKVEAHDVDLDLSGRVSYSIRNSNHLDTPTSSFSIHPASGVLSVHRSLDYEDTHTYNLIIEAVDQGHPPLTGTATVQLNVQDVNDNYPIIREPPPQDGVASLSVPVNAHKGQIVSELGNEADTEHTTAAISHSASEGGAGFLASTIKAEDLDSGVNGQLSYFIVNGNPDGLFWLDQSTGQLFVNTTNATDLIGKSFKVGISVSDMGSPSLVTTVTLEVTFINLKDHLKNSPGPGGQLSFTMMMTVCLGAMCLLLLLVVALVTTFCRPEKRDTKAYNCRQAESTYTRHPRRPDKSIRKSDIQLIPVIRGRKEPQLECCEAQPLDESSQYSHITSGNASFHSRGYTERDAAAPVSYHSKTLRKPGDVIIDGSRLQATPYQTLRKTRNSSSSSSPSSSSILKCQVKPEEEEVEHLCSASQVAHGRPKTSEGEEGHDTERRRILKSLFRLSMAALSENTIQLSSASPEVQQISQLLSLLHQGQLQPRPNFRGNKYSHRSRYGGQDCSDWQSTKDSGHGESEAGDVEWEPGRDSPIDPLLAHADNVFAEVDDPAWLARLSLPISSDYHDNVFFPNGPSSPDSELLPTAALTPPSLPLVRHQIRTAPWAELCCLR
ncbi:protocadherin-12 [Genypterus blacodes]|uniref:protocadherin-12 n=1 Tax=Genypterus blacodes TaxID=154954 RepID=UPI003F7694B2